MTIRFLTRCAAAFAMALAAAVASAQPYPNKPVKVVVPYPPGGPYDLIARVLGQKLGDSLGKPFVVENRAGASGMIGADAVAKAAPDGYTLLLGGIGPNAVNASLYPKITYNARTDFAPVVEVMRSPNILVVRSDVQANDVAELVKLAKSGKLAYASAGPGSSTHLFAEMFRLHSNIELQQVPYRGDAPAVQATLAGETPMYFASASSILPHIKSGRLKALAVTSGKRLSELPSVPTMEEAGLRGYEATAWYGLFAPAQTPPDIVSLLNEEVNKALRDPEVRKRLGEGTVEIVGGPADRFRATVAKEIDKWRGVVTNAKITVD